MSKALEALGYEHQSGNEYYNKELNKTIYFDYEKFISCFSYHTKPPLHRPEHLTLEEFKACQKIIQELGWLQHTTPQEVEEAIKGLEHMGDKDLYNGVHIEIAQTLRNYAFPKVSEDVEERLEHKLSCLNSEIARYENYLQTRDSFYKVARYEKQLNQAKEECAFLSKLEQTILALQQKNETKQEVIEQLIFDCGLERDMKNKAEAQLNEIRETWKSSKTMTEFYDFVGAIVERREK